MSEHSENPAYLVEHARERLLQDPRVGELDIHITVNGRLVVVTGHVSTRERCEAISEVLREMLPEHEIRNDTTVSVYPEGPEEEKVT